jgi:hypothetical protein
VDNEVEMMQKKELYSKPRYFPGMFLEKVRTHEFFSKDSWSPAKNLNSGPPKYEVGVLIIQSQHSVNSGIL